MSPIEMLNYTLLLISFFVNLLAVWGCSIIPPTMRTTSNRFTINLLVINLVGCGLLALTAYSSDGYNGSSGGDGGNMPAEEQMLSFAAAAGQMMDSIEYHEQASGNRQIVFKHNGKLVEEDGIILRRNHTANNGVADADADATTIEVIYKCNATYCQELTIDKLSERVIMTEFPAENLTSYVRSVHTTLNNAKQQQQREQEFELKEQPRIAMRSWLVDMAAALAALGVLLVVSDTWCAVTEPLHYNQCIFRRKTWQLIALTWLVGLAFGAMSAFRVLNFETETLLSRERSHVTASTSTSLKLDDLASIFSVVYACVYFVIIAVLPFGFVCGMYWRIFSEARGNGLRMRQNGSSPLLQSAMNLHLQQPSAHRHSISSASSLGGGLHMQIDQRTRASPSCLRRDSAAKVLLPTISDDGLSIDDSEPMPCQQPAPQQQQPPPEQQQILLVLQAASGEIKRNYSTQQLPLLGASAQELCDAQRGVQAVRQVHSSPNLQKYTCINAADYGSPHLLGHEQHTTLRQQNCLHEQRRQLHCTRHTHYQQQPQPQPHHAPVRRSDSSATQMQSSPKALGYMSSLRHRLSNASSLFRYREESRAARISILVVFMFLVSYLPFGLLVLLQSWFTAVNFAGATSYAVFMILLGQIASPCIFAYRYSDVRNAIKRTLRLQWSSEQQYQSSSFVGINSTKYSSNYLAPQEPLVHTTVVLNGNHSASTSVNLHAYVNFAPQVRAQHPKLERGNTIVEHISLPPDALKPRPRRSLLDIFFKSSKRLQSCVKEVSNAPTSV